MTDIYLVGLGVNSVQQVSRETEAAIGRCNEVLYLDTGVATGRYLAGLCPRVTALHRQSYGENELRMNAYRHMAACVIDAALARSPVAFAVHGHPLVAVYPTFLVCDLADVLGLAVTVQPAISSIDTIFAELRLDPCVEGLQMYEATDLLLRQRPLQTDVPALIWQIGSLESRLYTTARSRPARFARFVAWLARQYGGEHEVVAIYTPPHPLLPADVIRCRLDELAGHARAIHAGFSLYVPPLRRRAVRDAALLAALDDPAHLAKLVE